MVKKSSSAVDLLIDIGYFPVHVNLDLLKLNIRTDYADNILSTAENLLLESSDTDKVCLLWIYILSTKYEDLLFVELLLSLLLKIGNYDHSTTERGLAIYSLKFGDYIYRNFKPFSQLIVVIASGNFFGDYARDSIGNIM